MSQPKFRVGVLGAGYVADYHLRALQQEPDVQVVGIADPDLEKGRKTAAAFKIAGVYPGLGELVKEAKPNVIHVLTPPALHCPLAIQALDAGCHVFVEKPMAEKAEDCDKMIEA